jgi:hypothetical protein
MVYLCLHILDDEMLYIFIFLSHHPIIGRKRKSVLQQGSAKLFIFFNIEYQMLNEEVEPWCPIIVVASM